MEIEAKNKTICKQNPRLSEVYLGGRRRRLEDGRRLRRPDTIGEHHPAWSGERLEL